MSFWEDYKPELKTVAIAYGILILLVIIFCCSCGVQRKAEARVLSNEQSFNKIGAKWAKINPCVNDTEYVKRSDTVVRYDTIKAERPSGESGFFGYERPGPSFDAPAHDTTIPKKITIVKTITIHDTDLRYITDNRAVNLFKDSAKLFQIELTKAKAQLEVWKSDASKRLWIILGLAVLCGAAFAISVKNLI